MREYGYNYFVAGLSVFVEEGNASCMSLYQEFGGVKKGSRRVLAKKRRGVDAQLLLNICIDVSSIAWEKARKHTPRKDSNLKVSRSAAAAS